MLLSSMCTSQKPNCHTTVEPRTLYNSSTLHVFTFTLQRTELILGREVRFCAGLLYLEDVGAVTHLNVSNGTASHRTGREVGAAAFCCRSIGRQFGRFSESS